MPMTGPGSGRPPATVIASPASWQAKMAGEGLQHFTVSDGPRRGINSFKPLRKTANVDDGALGSIELPGNVDLA